MATSSYFPTSNNYIKYWFEVIQTSQSISGNYSTLTVKVWAKRTNTGYTTWGDGSVSCTINGTAFPDTGSYTITSTPVCLRNITGFKVNHNSDGTKSLTVSGSIAIPGAGLSSSSHSFTTSLTTIPRTSSFSLSSSSVNAGSAITVNITRASSSFTHKVNFSFGSHSVSLGSSVATSVSYTIPLSYLDAIPSSTSGSAKIVVDTYNGSTKIGSTSKTFTITAPSSVVPSFSSLGITRVDNGVPSTWGIYVKGKSKATLAINGASGSYGSSIVRYAISGGGYSSTASSFTTGVLNTVGTNTFTATITDSRGRTATKTVTCSVVDYFTPRISYVEAYRCTSAGVIDENGTYIKAKANFSYASLGGKNTFSANMYYSVYNSGTWSSAVGIANNIYGIIGNGTISVDNSYDVKFRVADYFTSHEVFDIVSTPSVTMDFKKGGKGIGIGKVSETDGLLDIGWGCNVGGDFSVDKRTFLMGTLDVEGFSSFFGGMNINNGVNVFNKTSNVNIYANSNNADYTLYRLYNLNKVLQVNFTLGATGEALRMHTYTNGTWRSNIIFYENGSIKCTGVDSTGDVNINGGYLKVGGKNFRGWGFSSGNKYYLGLSGSDDYVRMYNDDITVANGVTYLGSPSGRFIKLYSTQAVDVSSDLRKKDNIMPYDTQLEIFYDLLRPISYTLKQGHTGRRHLGFIAQEVEHAMTEVGMEYKDLSFLQKAPLDENGQEIDPNTITDYSTDERIKDYEYSLAYTELISLNTHMIQKLKAENKKLTDEVNSLKNEINEIKTALGLG